MHVARMAAPVALAATLAACDRATEPGAPVAEISIDPPTASVEVDDAVRFTASMRDADGNAVSGRAVTWTVERPEIAAVSGGQVTGIAPGTTRIAANAEGLSATAAVTVRARRLVPVTVDVDPPSFTLRSGRTRELTATVRDAYGTEVTDATIEWSSSAPTVAVVDGDGEVLALLPGEADIVATAGDARGSAHVTVEAPKVDRVEVKAPSLELREGETMQLQAILYDDEGNPLTGPEVHWSSDEPSKAQVSQDGVVTAKKKGKAKITAESQGRTDTVKIEIEGHDHHDDDEGE